MGLSDLSVSVADSSAWMQAREKKQKNVLYKER
jgi:hypothetical protein